MNPKTIVQLLNELRALPYFPDDEYVLLSLTRLVGSMCADEDQVRWLVGRMTSGLYERWMGPHELRACFCSRFKPKDGINAYSTVYPDGIPSQTATAPQITGPEFKALPPGHETSTDSRAEVAFRIANTVQSQKQALFDAPITDAELEACPTWLKRIEDYPVRKAGALVPMKPKGAA